MKINITQIASAGIMLALITCAKYMDLIMPKTPVGSSWIEFYMALAIIFVLVLPMPVTLLVLIIAPLIWFMLGLTWQTSPFSFFLDYSLPLMSSLIIYLARFCKTKSSKYLSIILLVVCAFIIKWLSHTVSGVIGYHTDFLPSASLNAPMVFTTMAFCLGTTLLIVPKLNELQKLVNQDGMKW